MWLCIELLLWFYCRFVRRSINEDVSVQFCILNTLFIVLCSYRDAKESKFWSKKGILDCVFSSHFGAREIFHFDVTLVILLYCYRYLSITFALELQNCKRHEFIQKWVGCWLNCNMKSKTTTWNKTIMPLPCWLSHVNQEPDISAIYVAHKTNTSIYYYYR